MFKVEAGNGEEEQKKILCLGGLPHSSLWDTLRDDEPPALLSLACMFGEALKTNEKESWLKKLRLVISPPPPNLKIGPKILIILSQFYCICLYINPRSAPDQCMICHISFINVWFVIYHQFNSVCFAIYHLSVYDLSYIIYQCMNCHISFINDLS